MPPMQSEVLPFKIMETLSAGSSGDVSGGSLGLAALGVRVKKLVMYVELWLLGFFAEGAPKRGGVTFDRRALEMWYLESPAVPFTVSSISGSMHSLSPSGCLRWKATVTRLSL